MVGTYIMAMLRSGTNTLAIENDRRNNIPIRRRICRYCKTNKCIISDSQIKIFNLPCNKSAVVNNANSNIYQLYGDANVYANITSGSIPIEDEFHFILDCPAYNAQRELLYDQIYLLTNKQLDLCTIHCRMVKMKIILGNIHVYKEIHVRIKKEIIIKIIEKCKLFLFRCMNIRNNCHRYYAKEGEKVSGNAEDNDDGSEDDVNTRESDGVLRVDEDEGDGINIDIDDFMNKAENEIYPYYPID